MSVVLYISCCGYVAAMLRLCCCEVPAPMFLTQPQFKIELHAAPWFGSIFVG